MGRLEEADTDKLLEELTRRLELPSRNMDYLGADDLAQHFASYLDYGNLDVLEGVKAVWGPSDLVDSAPIEKIECLSEALDLLSRLSRPSTSEDYGYALADTLMLLARVGMHNRRTRAADVLQFED